MPRLYASLLAALVLLAACDTSTGFDLDDLDDLPGGEPGTPQYDDQFVRASVGGTAWEARGLTNPGELGVLFFGEDVELLGADFPDVPLTFVFGSILTADFVEPGARIVQAIAYRVQIDEVALVEGEQVASGRSESLFVTALVDADGTPISDPDLEVPMVNYVACDFEGDTSEACDDGTGVFTAVGDDAQVTFSELSDTELVGTFAGTATSEGAPSQTLSIANGAFSLDLAEAPGTAPVTPWATQPNSAPEN